MQDNRPMPDAGSLPVDAEQHSDDGLGRGGHGQSPPRMRCDATGGMSTTARQEQGGRRQGRERSCSSTMWRSEKTKPERKDEAAPPSSSTLSPEQWRRGAEIQERGLAKLRQEQQEELSTRGAGEEQRNTDHASATTRQAQHGEVLEVARLKITLVDELGISFEHFSHMLRRWKEIRDFGATLEEALDRLKELDAEEEARKWEEKGFPDQLLIQQETAERLEREKREQSVRDRRAAKGLGPLLVGDSDGQEADHGGHQQHGDSKGESMSRKRDEKGKPATFVVSAERFSTVFGKGGTTTMPANVNYVSNKPSPAEEVPQPSSPPEWTEIVTRRGKGKSSKTAEPVEAWSGAVSAVGKGPVPSPAHGLPRTGGASSEPSRREEGVAEEGPATTLHRATSESDLRERVLKLELQLTEVELLRRADAQELHAFIKKRHQKKAERSKQNAAETVPRSSSVPARRPSEKAAPSSKTFADLVIEWRAALDAN